MLNPRYASTHWGHEISTHFENYWRTDPAFSKSKLDKYRQNNPSIRRSLPDHPLLKDSFPTDPAAAIDNKVHPLFQFTNFITPLPLEEVRDQMEPALRLASHFISNDHALGWFIHVRFATMLPVQSGARILIRRAGTITKSMLDTVKIELLDLAGRLPIAFFSTLEVGSKREAHGVTCPTYMQVLEYLKASEADMIKSKMSTNNNRVMILLHLNFFYEALQHHYCNTTPTQVRCFQFYLAQVLLHELAHAWMMTCHPSAQHGEPIVCSGDIFPESGFSWENFMFGARVGHVMQTFRPLLQTSTFSSLFTTPRHIISAIVPAAWTSQWFLKSTWENFVNLHSTGALLAPSADRSVAAFSTMRYCSSDKTLHWNTYLNGQIHSNPCCAEETCSAREPGTQTRWPKDLLQFRTLLLSLVESDIAAAKVHGVDISDAIRDVEDGLYEETIRRADVGEICRARGAVLEVFRARPKTRGRRLFDRFRGAGKGVAGLETLVSVDDGSVSHYDMDVFDLDILQ